MVQVYQEEMNASQEEFKATVSAFQDKTEANQEKMEVTIRSSQGRPR
jgi:hypothetical protein